MVKKARDFDKSLNNGYIEAPYRLEENESINGQYLEPVFFENENLIAESLIPKLKSKDSKTLDPFFFEEQAEPVETKIPFCSRV